MQRAQGQHETVPVRLAGGGKRRDPHFPKSGVEVTYFMSRKRGYSPRICMYNESKLLRLLLEGSTAFRSAFHGNNTGKKHYHTANTQNAHTHTHTYMHTHRQARAHSHIQFCQE